MISQAPDSGNRIPLRHGRAALTVVVTLGLLVAAVVTVSNRPASSQNQTVTGAEPVPMPSDSTEATPLTKTETDDDFPSAAVAGDGTVWCAYVSYHRGKPVNQKETDAGRFDSLQPHGNGDQVRLMRYADGTWSVPLKVTNAGLDVWRPAVVCEGDGAVQVLWSQQVDGNWDLYARRYDPKQNTFDAVRRLTDQPGTDFNVAAVVSVPTGLDQGQTWVAWQSKREGQFDILLARLADGELRSQQRVSFSEANDWNPAIAATSRGDVWVAWDTYHKGDYDVYVRRLSGGTLQKPVPVAVTGRFEGRVSLAVDQNDRLWTAYEEGDFNWGKDYGPRLTGKGYPFYYERTIRVRCLTAEGLLKTKSAIEAPPIYTHYDDTRYKAEFKQRISQPRLCVDGAGSVWLLYRRHPLPQTARGERWVSFARRYSGDAWSPEMPLPHSDNLLDNRPAPVPFQDHGLLAVYSTDGRTDGSRSAQVNNLYALRLKSEEQPRPPVLVPMDSHQDGSSVSSPVGTPPADPHEAENVQRCREYRIRAGGKAYRLLRGEFHRHSEISAHRDWDGTLENVWRYGLDVAAMDWIGPGDHDYGVEKEYMWWLTQKQIDLYYDPQTFLSMYTYERSVPYPSGHRNVMFAERGIRPLPQMNGREKRFGTAEDGSPDIQNLYKYLQKFDGICSSHTPATNMGTDWRDSNPHVEPVVEIFQGHRQNYEETNAPLAAHNAEETIQGYRPAGFVWQAFKKGVKLGFQSSSDHVSTHTSYGFVLAEEPTRRGVIEAFRKRHSYAANDNILMDVRCGEHLMGDEFTTVAPPKLDVRVVGTAPIKRVDIVRQIGAELPQYVYNATPGEPEVRFSWTDNDAQSGQVNMYYVRIQQDDSRLAWASPMWILYKPKEKHP